MRLLRLIAFGFLLTGVNLFAQSNDYFSIKEVKSYRFDHLNISNNKDAETFIHATKEFNFIEALKIGDVTVLDNVLSKIGSFYGLKEINLVDYHGDFTNMSFDSCKEVEILHISIDEAKLDQLKYLSDCKNLRTLYVYVVGKPEKIDGFNNLPSVRELHLIGDFLPNDVVSLVNIVNQQSSIKTFGISLDRITDLPNNIAKLKVLDKLIIYDNLSVFTNKGIDDLSEEKLSILYDQFTDNISAISISYLSNNGSLSDFETDYIQAIYKGELLNSQSKEDDQIGDDGVNIPFNKEFTPDFPKTPEFNSPYSSILPSEEVFVINPNVNSILNTQSGMTISIAANSFINENSEAVSDPIYIRVTQITKPTELLFAGLNLSNGTNQYTNQFLFNIQATAEKSAARLKDGYQIKVGMPVAADSSIAHFYDYESNTWQNLNFYNEIFANNFEPLDFHKIETSSSTQQLYLFDTTNFDNRYKSKHAIYLNDKDNNSELLFKTKSFYADLDRTWNKDFNLDGKLKGLRIKKGKSYLKIQKVIPKERNKSRQYFKILDKSSVGLFPEIKAFNNINFNVEFTPESKKEFNDNFIKNIKYMDVRIQYTKGKSTVDILLKTAEGFRKLTAFVVDTDDKKLLKKQLKKFQKCYDKYLKTVHKKRIEFNELNLLRFEEFKLYNANRINQLKKNLNYSVLKIHQLGTFGMFYNQTPAFNTSLIAQYTDLKGLPIDIKNIYMIDNRYNTVFKILVGNLTFEPANCEYIIATDYSGNLYYANKNDVSASNVSNNSLTYIKLKKVPSNVKDINVFNGLIKN